MPRLDILSLAFRDGSRNPAIGRRSIRAGAAAHGRATEKGDFVAANEAHHTVASVYRELRRRGVTAQRALLPLIVHDEAGVRGWAASHALEFAPEEGEAVLIAMSDVAKSKVSFSARLTLKEWRAGRLRFP